MTTRAQRNRYKYPVTASELGLSDAEYAALIKTRNMLARHGTNERAERESGTAGYKLDGFGVFHLGDMCVSPDGVLYDNGVLDIDVGYSCGTAGCIAGWMGLFMHGAAPRAGERHYVTPEVAKEIANFVSDFYTMGSRGSVYNPLTKLFYLRDEDGNLRWSYADITPAHAVRAIDNVLTVKSPRWDEVFAS